MTGSSPPEDCPRNLVDCVAALEAVLDRCDEITGERRRDWFFDGRASAARLVRDIIRDRLTTTEEQQ